MKVVIKRKRDEPVLPSFVLANKRPALSRLSIGDGAPDPPMIRYTLVGLTPGSTNVPEASGKEQQQAHEPDARPNPSNSRFRTVAMHSTADGQVLELQRCEPKLVPFGPPLPPRSRPVPQARSCTNADTAVDDIWRDAAAASGSLEGNLSPQPMADEYVYDEYTVAADADDDGDAASKCARGMTPRSGGRSSMRMRYASWRRSRRMDPIHKKRRTTRRMSPRMTGRMTTTTDRCAAHRPERRVGVVLPRSGLCQSQQTQQHRIQ